jgi:hypothetical protein
MTTIATEAINTHVRIAERLPRNPAMRPLLRRKREKLDPNPPWVSPACFTPDNIPLRAAGEIDTLNRALSRVRQARPTADAGRLFQRAHTLLASVATVPLWSGLTYNTGFTNWYQGWVPNNRSFSTLSKIRQI